MLGVAAAVAVTVVEPRAYTARATVLVIPTGLDDSGVVTNGRTTSTVNLDTEAQLATSGDVATQVQKTDRTLAGSSTRDLASNVTVSVPANTSVLNLSFEASNARVAQRGAQAFADAYLVVRRNIAQATLDRRIARLQTNLATLDGLLSTAINDVAVTRSTPNSAPAELARSTRDRYTRQINSLSNQVVSLQATVVTAGRVLSPAALPASASSPSWLLNVAGGFGIGLLIGLLVAAIRVRRPSRLRHGDDIERILQVPVLATLGQPGKGSSLSRQLDDSEAILRLANVLRATVRSGGTVLVIAADDRETSRSLALDLARGLDSLTGSASHLDLAAAAAGGTHPGRIRRPENTEWLVVGARSPLQSASGQAVAVDCDAVILVTGAILPTRTAKQIVRMLDEVSAPLLGVVRIRSRRKSSKSARRAGASPAHDADHRVSPDTADPGLAESPSAVAPAVSGSAAGVGSRPRQ